MKGSIISLHSNLFYFKKILETTNPYMLSDAVAVNDTVMLSV